MENRFKVYKNPNLDTNKVANRYKKDGFQVYKNNEDATLNNVLHLQNNESPVQPQQVEPEVEVDVQSPSLLPGILGKAESTVNDVAFDLGKGILKFFEGIGDFLGTGVASVGDAFGADTSGLRDLIAQDLSEKYLNSKFVSYTQGGLINALSGKYKDKSLYEQTKEASLLNKAPEIVQEGVHGVAQSIGEMLPSIAIGGLSGSQVLQLGSFGLGAAGNASEQAINEGASNIQALGYGALSGATEVATEKLFDVFGFFGGGVADRILAKGGKPFKLVAGLLGEGVEEVLSDLAAPAWKKVVGMAETYQENAPSFADLAESFALGSITSMIMGGASTANSLVRYGANGTKYLSLNEDLTDINDAVNNEIDRVIKDRVTKKQWRELQKDSQSYNNLVAEVMDELDSLKQGNDSNLPKAYRNIQELIDSKNKIIGKMNNLLNNMSEEKAQKIRSKKVGTITENGVKRDYTLGEQIYNNTIDISDINNHNVTFDKGVNVVGKANISNNQVSIDELSNQNFSNKQKVQANRIVRAVNEINKRFNTNYDVVFTDGLVGKNDVKLNGANDRGTFYININSKKALLKTTMHELTHSLENTDVYKELSKYAKEKMGKDAFEEAIKAKKSSYKKLNQSQESILEQEVVADAVGDMFDTYEDVKKLVSANDSLARKIKNWIARKFNQSKGDTVLRKELKPAYEMINKALNEKKSQKEAQNVSKSGKLIADGIRYEIADDGVVVITATDEALKNENGEYKSRKALLKTIRDGIVKKFDGLYINADSLQNIYVTTYNTQEENRKKNNGVYSTANEMAYGQNTEWLAYHKKSKKPLLLKSKALLELDNIIKAFNVVGYTEGNRPLLVLDGTIKIIDSKQLNGTYNAKLLVQMRTQSAYDLYTDGSWNKEGKYIKNRAKAIELYKQYGEALLENKKRASKIAEAKMMEETLSDSSISNDATESQEKVEKSFNDGELKKLDDSYSVMTAPYTSFSPNTLKREKLARNRAEISQKDFVEKIINAFGYKPIKVDSTIGGWSSDEYFTNRTKMFHEISYDFEFDKKDLSMEELTLIADLSADLLYEVQEASLIVEHLPNDYKGKDFNWEYRIPIKKYKKDLKGILKHAGIYGYTINQNSNTIIINDYKGTVTEEKIDRIVEDLGDNYDTTREIESTKTKGLLRDKSSRESSYKAWLETQIRGFKWKDEYKVRELIKRAKSRLEEQRKIDALQPYIQDRELAEKEIFSKLTAYEDGRKSINNLTKKDVETILPDKSKITSTIIVENDYSKDIYDAARVAWGIAHERVYDIIDYTFEKVKEKYNIGYDSEHAQSQQKSVKSIVSRIYRNIHDHKGSHPFNLKDLVRTTYTFDESNVKDAKAVAHYSHENFSKPETPFHLKSPGAGYMPIHLNLNINGIPTEIQFHTEKSWKAKLKGDAIYDRIRMMKDETTLTDEQKVIKKNLIAESEKNFADAYTHDSVWQELHNQAEEYNEEYKKDNSIKYSADIIPTNALEENAVEVDKVSKKKGIDDTKNIDSNYVKGRANYDNDAVYNKNVASKLLDKSLISIFKERNGKTIAIKGNKDKIINYIFQELNKTKLEDIVSGKANNSMAKELAEYIVKNISTDDNILPNDYSSLVNELSANIQDAYLHDGKVAGFKAFKDKVSTKIADLKQRLRWNKRLVVETRKMSRAINTFKSTTNRKYSNNPSAKPLDKMFTPAVDILKKLKLTNFFTQQARDIMKESYAVFCNENNEMLKDDYSQMIVDMIDSIANGSGNLDIYEMNTLVNIYQSLNKLMKYYDNVVFEDRVQKASEVAKNLETDIASGRSINKNIKSTAFNSIQKPRLVLRQFDGSVGDKDNSLTSLVYGELRKAEDTYKKNDSSFKEKLLEFESKHKKFTERMFKETAEIKGKKIPLGEAITIYQWSRREQARGHFMTDVNPSAQGINIYSQKNGNFLGTFTLTQEDVDKLYNSFDKETLEYINFIDGLIEDAKALKEETDYKALGFTNAVEDFYFPIMTDSMYNSYKNFGDVRNVKAIDSVLGLSMNKNVVTNANNRLRLQNAYDIVNRHLNQASKYNAYYVTIKAIQKSLNTYTENKTTAKQSLMALNPEIIDYIDNLIIDVADVRQHESKMGEQVSSFLRGNLATANLGLNLKVMFNQLSSIPTALSILSPTSIAKSYKMGIGKNAANEMDKYCRYTYYRNFYNTKVMSEIYRSDSNTIVDSGYSKVKQAYHKVQNLVMQPISWMDRRAMVRLWNACQVEVEAKQGLKLGTEENKNKAAELLEKVVRETQPDYSPLEAPTIKKSRSELVRWMTMFTTQPLQNLNQIIEASNDIKNIKSQIKAKGTSEELTKQLKQANRKLMRNVSSVLAANLMYTLIGLGFKQFLGKRKEDEGIAKEFILDFMGSNVGMIPIVREIYNKLFNNYDITADPLGAVNDFIDATKSIYNNVSDGNYQGLWYKLSKALSTLTGIPFKNINEYSMAIIGAFSPSTAYKYRSIWYNKTVSSFTDDLEKAITKNDDSQIDAIIQALYSKKGISLNATSAKELNKLSKESTKKIISLKNVSSTVTINGEQVEINDPSKIKKYYSQNVNASLDNLIKNAYYAGLSNEEKAYAVKLSNDASYYKALTKALNTDIKENKINLLTKAFSGTSYYTLIAALSKCKNSLKGNQQQIQKYINSLRLSKEQKYILYGLAGYKSLNENSSTQVSNYLSSKGYDKTMREYIMDFAKLL